MNEIEGTNTYLLRLIYNLLSLEFKMTRYQFFEKITTDMDTELIEKYRIDAGRNYWLAPRKVLVESEKYTKDITDNYLKFNIANTIRFDPTLWDEEDAKIQENKIKESIKTFLDKENNLLKKITLPTYKELKQDLSPKEQELLKELKKGKAEAFKRIIHDNINLSQEMLLAMIVLAYKFGHYQQLVNYLFPPLTMSNRMNPKILFIYANALGSHQLKEYGEASLILSQINTEDNLEYIDTQTAMTSNFLRHRLTEDLDENELRNTLYVQTKNYKILFERDKTYNYYPAINYAYMIAIAQQLYPKDKKFQKLYNDITINALLKQSQDSINADKQKEKNSDANYYATITELEFSLIRNINIIHKIEHYLDEKKPDISLVQRSLRQIIFFKDILESSVDEVSFNIARLNKVIDMIDGYISFESE